MRCPRCGVARLQETTVTYRKPTRIDRCECCLGLWLDRDELDATVSEHRYMNAFDRGVLSFLEAHVHEIDSMASKAAENT